MANAEIGVLTEAFSDAGRWSTPYRHSGAYQLTDPLEGGRLDTWQPPVWISEDKILGCGLSYLRENASRLRVTVLRSRHEEANDLGPVEEKRFEWLVRRRANFYGYEAYSHTQEDLAKQHKLADEITQAVRAAGKPLTLEYFMRCRVEGGYSSFSLRRLAALTIINTPAAPADIAGDGSATERALTKAHLPILCHQDNEVRGAAAVGFQNMREWVMIARFGLGMQAAEAQGNESPGDAMRGVMTVGEWHQDVGRKLRTLDVLPTLTSGVPGSYDPRANVGTSRIFRTGTIGRDDLPLAHEFAEDVLWGATDKLLQDAAA